MHFSADTVSPDPADNGQYSVAPRRRGASPAPPVRHPRQLDHDIQHELATIALLASLLETADDVGPDSRRRAEQIVRETRWLDRLVRSASTHPRPVRSDASGRFDSFAHPNSSGRFDPPAHADPARCPERPVPLDRVAAEVVAAAQLSTAVVVDLEADETWAPVDPLTFWRVLTNLVGNAVRAAGAQGEVRVRVCATDAQAVVEVEDDGPGFGAGPAGSGSHGLDITRDLVLSMAGKLQIGNGTCGGCRVRLCLPVLPSGHTERISA